MYYYRALAYVMFSECVCVLVRKEMNSIIYARAHARPLAEESINQCTPNMHIHVGTPARYNIRAKWHIYIVILFSGRSLNVLYYTRSFSYFSSTDFVLTSF